MDAVVYVGLLLIFVHYSFANHDNGPNKLHECRFCACFTEYQDRDVWVPLQPYRVASKPLDVTQDECIALCADDPGTCKAVVYGLVGGRNIYTCELYNELKLADSLQYVYGLNTFVPKDLTKCPDLDDFRLVDINDGPDDSPTKRKQFYQQLNAKPNPFYWGRR